MADAPYAGCDATGCPLRIREALPGDALLAAPPVVALPVEIPPDRGAANLEHDLAIRHRKLIVVDRFEY